MKRLILIGFIFIIACKKNYTDNSVTVHNNYNMNTEKKIYYIDYHIPGSTSIDIYINNIKIKTSSLSGYEELNPYILKSSTVDIKIRLYSLEPELDNGKKIGIRKTQPYSITQFPNELTPLRVRIYTTDEKEENIEKLIEFSNPPINQPVPFYEAYWEFEAELPYEFEAWNKAQDLSKWDEDKLKDKVVAKFKEYRELLNTGKYQEFMKLQEFSNTQTFNSLFYSQQIRSEILSTNFFELQKNIMMPLENYTMKLYANGKLVTLERVDIKPMIATNVDGGKFDTYLYGQSALVGYREKPLEEDGISYYYDYVLLMMPKGSDELQIARVIQNIN